MTEATAHINYDLAPDPVVVDDDVVQGLITRDSTEGNECYGEIRLRK